MIPSPYTAPELLEREFLVLRAKLLELAAGFDRLDRAPGTIADHPRYQQLLQALHELDRAGADRAERLQLIFSLPYDPQWRDRLGVDRAVPVNS